MRRLLRAGGRLARVGAWLLLLLACATPQSSDPQGEAWSRYQQEGLGAYQQGRYAEAEASWQQALEVAGAFSRQDPRLHRTLEELAGLFEIGGQLARAESLYVRLLALQHENPQSDGLAGAATLAKLAGLYRAQGQLVRAESLYVRLLALQQDHPEPTSQAIATTLARLADLHRARGALARADSLDRRALGLKLHAQGCAYFLQGNDRQAAALFRQALQIQERNLGADHPDLARTYADWARLCQLGGDPVQAERLYRRALAIQETIPGGNPGDRLRILEQLSELCEKTGRAEEAAVLAGRAAALRGR